MKVEKITRRGVLLRILAIALILVSFKKDEIDALHRRVFNISFSETINGVAAKKSIAGQFTFKNGRLHSDFLCKKFGYSDIPYRAIKDSVYTDATGNRARLLKVKASMTRYKGQAVLIDLVINEENIKGNVKISRYNQLKKQYSLAGHEQVNTPETLSNNETAPVFDILN